MTIDDDYDEVSADHDNEIDDIEATSGEFSKVLDFSTDGDQLSDHEYVYTGATLDAGPLPESFTICSAIMVDAWTSEFTAADMFTLLDDDGKNGHYTAHRAVVRSVSSY